MDPLGAASSAIDISYLPKWSSTPIPDYPKESEDSESYLPSPFPVREDINDRVILW